MKRRASGNPPQNNRITRNTITARTNRSAHFIHQNRKKLLSILLVLMLLINARPFSFDKVMGADLDGISIEMNAYINNSSVPENGESGAYASIDFDDVITYEVIVNNNGSASSYVPIPPTVPKPVFQSGGSQKPQPINFINGGFEEPVLPGGAGAEQMYPHEQVPGWSTNPLKESDNGNPDAYKMRLHKPQVGTTGDHAQNTPDGSAQYAEINSTVEKSIYQTVDTVPGSKLYWEFYHGAKRYYSSGVNTDTLDFTLRKEGLILGGLIAQSTASYTTGSTIYNWTYNSGSYVVPAGQTRTEFRLTSTLNASRGIYVDAVRFYSGSYIELALSDDAAYGEAAANDVITYTLVATNTGQADSKNTKVNFVLPIGTNFVPGSVKIDGISTGNYNYSAGSHELNVNVGAGATVSNGGFIKGIDSPSSDAANSYAITYQVKVNDEEIAEDLLYESQATVTYEDRPDTSSSPASFVNYSNVDAFELAGVKTAKITVALPEGMTYISHTVDNGSNFEISGQTATWSWVDDLPLGETVVTIKMQVDPVLESSFVSQARVWRGISFKESNGAYHRLPLADARKNAYVNGSAAPHNGSQNHPVLVELEDEIKYTISATNEKEISLLPPKYDVLFVLDWSNSMSANMNSNLQMARIYERDVMLNMTEFVISTYPGSRVAVLGLNSSETNTNDEQYTLIEYQTDFLDETAYFANKVGIQSAFINTPVYQNDDNATFLNIAIDKMTGLSTTYGSTLPQGPKQVIPRTGSDLGVRIPVVMVLSDFQLGEEPTNGQVSWNRSGLPYWSVVMSDVADRFSSELPRGILQMVRLDHINNSSFNTIMYDNYMKNYVSPAGRANWGFTKVPYNTPYTTALNSIKNDFIDLVPYEGEQGTIITDVVPEGLEVDPGSISHGGFYNQSTRTIVWDLSLYDNGPITVEFTATVKQTESFVNTGTVIRFDGTEGTSNATYHRALPLGVIEYFRELGNENNVLDETIDSTVIEINAGAPYVPAPGIPPAMIVKNDVTYIYYGYRINDGLVDLMTHESLPSALISSVNSATVVTYLYVQQPIKNAFINGSSIPQNGTDSIYQLVNKGDMITYEITVNNQYPGQENSSFMLMDVLPFGLTYESHTDKNGSSFSNAGQITVWQWDNLPQGETTVSVTVKVNPSVLPTYVNSATFNSAGYSIKTNSTYHELVSDVSFIFYKVDEHDDPMKDVKFLLYTCTDDNPETHNHPWLVSNDTTSCWSDAKAISSKANGMVEFPELPSGSYMLVEVETHQGYQLPQGQWLIEIDNTLAIDITAHGLNSVTLPPAFKYSVDGEDLLLPNYRQMVMPMAGGPGLITLTVLGVVLLADGIIYAILPKRKGKGVLKVSRG